MDDRAAEQAGLDPARALEDPNDATHGTSRSLLLGAHDQRDELGLERPSPAPVFAGVARAPRESKKRRVSVFPEPRRFLDSQAVSVRLLLACGARAQV